MALQWLHAATYWGSLAAILYTKAEDVHSTALHVGPDAEVNPAARWLFQRVGFRAGLALVYLLVVAVCGATYPTVWAHYSAPVQVGTALAGWAIAAAQHEAARFNTQRTHSPLSRLLLRAYLAWGRLAR